MRKITADVETIGNRILSTSLTGKSAASRAHPEMIHASNHHLIWVTRGGGRLFIDGSQQGFGPNTAMFIPADTLFHLELSFGAVGWKVAVPSSLRIPLPQNAILTTVLIPLQQAQLSTGFASLQAEYISKLPFRGTSLIYSAGLLAVLFQRLDSNANRKEVEVDNAKRRLMRRFIQRVNTRFSTTDTVRDYAANLGVTPTHLTRVCRETGGKPATRFIQEKVLDEAKVLLKESNQKIASIADDLGFQTPAYFSRVFSEQVGVSPRQYRNNNRK